MGGGEAKESCSYTATRGLVQEENIQHHSSSTDNFEMINVLFFL